MKNIVRITDVAEKDFGVVSRILLRTATGTRWIEQEIRLPISYLEEAKASAEESSTARALNQDKGEQRA